jgi:serine/threonine protein kinase
MPLHQVVSRFGDPQHDEALLAQVEHASWKAKVQVLLDTGLDPTSFIGRFQGPKRSALRAALEATYRRREETQEFAKARGYLGVLLLTLILLEEAEVGRFGSVRFWSTSQRNQADPQLCDDLVQDPEVRAWLQRLYQPPHPRASASEQERMAWAKWSTIDFDTLRFYRQGTTSFILRCMTRKSRDREETPSELALKLVLYPYTQLPPIAESTRKYAAEYRLADDERALHIPRVWASTEKWIIMDFVPGRTLQEELRERARRQQSTAEDQALDLEQLKELAPALFRALGWLNSLRKPLHHLDLSPSNIIVQRSEDEPGDDHTTVVLVDLGPNYLYTQAISAMDGPEAIYVSPEVRDTEAAVETARADLYSLGHILIALTGIARVYPGIVPDQIYEQAPLLARFIEDLMDHDPQNRLQLFGSSGALPDYRTLHMQFFDELHATMVAERERLRPNDKRWLRGLWLLWPPSSKVPRRQLELWYERLRQRSPELDRNTLLPRWAHRLPVSLAALWLLLHPTSARGATSNEQEQASRWLLCWSIVCNVSWWLCGSVTIIWMLRDLNLDPAGVFVQALRISGKVQQHHYPLVDDLARHGYEIRPSVSYNVRHNLPARVIALSFALIGTKYYQNLFGGLTARFARGRFSSAGEFFIRLHSCHWVVLILLGNWYEPRWWPALSAIGLCGTLGANYFCAQFAQEAIARARSEELRLSTVPSKALPIAGLEEFSGWWQGMVLYLLVVIPCAMLIQAGALHDEWIYAAFVATINVGLFYVIKCSRRGAAVRGALTRAFLAAERLAMIRRRLDQQLSAESLQPAPNHPDRAEYATVDRNRRYEDAR